MTTMNFILENSKHKKCIYLASPYSDPDSFVMDNRWNVACKVAAKLIELGFFVISPLGHSKSIQKHLDKEFITHDIWIGIDYKLLSVCDMMFVIMEDGTLKSTGVALEIEYCKNNNIPIIGIKFNDITKDIIFSKLF